MLSGRGITKIKTQQLSATYRQNVGKVNYNFINLSAQALSFITLYREAETYQATPMRYGILDPAFILETAIEREKER